MIFIVLTISALFGSAMLMSMLEMPTPAWVKVAAVVKRRR